MADRRAYKTDASFLEKLVIGATGTKGVFADLQKQGHRPIELERGSMSYKIWKKIKIKRLRVPDLLCLACATRTEARAKTDLEISMSHSLADEERSWDKGLGDNDMVGLALCTRTGMGATDWEASDLIQYIPAKALRRAFQEKQTIVSEAKGSQEGFEVRVLWPSAVASADGSVKAVSGDRVQIQRSADNLTLSYSLKRRDIGLKILVAVGDPVRAGQIIASVVPVTRTFKCRGGASANTYMQLLTSLAVP
ncbi:MAG TPA: hypothetical protein VGQ99_22300, partial [Tepidisphaeraceae bacterium]|nr:hypothetical protein [Tepidisphaeraceae bacterium]